MIIPDTEEILYVGKNQLTKGIFYKQGFIISIAPLVVFASAYVFFQALNPFAYYAIILIAYVVLSLLTTRNSYNNYARYFGSDEVAISKTKLYYNICMNIAGRYTNFDDSRDLKEIDRIYIKSGWNPNSLVIYFKDGDHIAIHSLKNIDEVKSKIEELIC